MWSAGVRPRSRLTHASAAPRPAAPTAAQTTATSATVVPALAWRDGNPDAGAGTGRSSHVPGRSARTSPQPSRHSKAGRAAQQVSTSASTFNTISVTSSSTAAPLLDSRPELARELAHGKYQLGDFAAPLDRLGASSGHASTQSRCRVALRAASRRASGTARSPSPATGTGSLAASVHRTAEPLAWH